MACFHPIKGYRDPEGKIRFNRPSGSSEFQLTIPCGQCVGCRLERSRQWAVRIMHEAQMHDQNCFITLTYNDEHLPADLSVNVKHFQQFCRNLRKKIKFRFYHCGEYGDETQRPHYHAAIFGTDFTHDRTLFKHTKRGDPLYTSPSLDKAWGKGHAYIGNLTYESAAYTARYIMKKVNGSQKDDYYLRSVDITSGECKYVNAEYTTMSRRPGIGKTWLDKYHTDVYPSDEVISNGHPSRPPKYYDQQQEIRDPDQIFRLKIHRQKATDLHSENNTPSRLQTRENITQARIKHLKREL